MANHTTWTGEQQATLEDMARDGYSAGMVARKIGKSRNAVIGRASRGGVIWAGMRSPDHKGVPSRRLWPEDDLMALKSMAEACLGAAAASRLSWAGRASLSRPRRSGWGLRHCDD